MTRPNRRTHAIAQHESYTADDQIALVKQVLTQLPGRPLAPGRSATVHRRRWILVDDVRGEHSGPSVGDLEVRHRSRARCKDHIRIAKDSGLGIFPLKGIDQNRIWLAIAAFAGEISDWPGLLGFGEHEERRWETKRLRLCYSGLSTLWSWSVESGRIPGRRPGPAVGSHPMKNRGRYCGITGDTWPHSSRVGDSHYLQLHRLVSAPSSNSHLLLVWGQSATQLGTGLS